MGFGSTPANVAATTPALRSASSMGERRPAATTPLSVTMSALAAPMRLAWLPVSLAAATPNTTRVGYDQIANWGMGRLYSREGVRSKKIRRRSGPAPIVIRVGHAERAHLHRRGRPRAGNRFLHAGFRARSRTKARRRWRRASRRADPHRFARAPRGNCCLAERLAPARLRSTLAAASPLLP